MKPFPTELQNTINPEPSGKHASVEFQRNLFCSHYDDCLDEAVKKGWNSFTCVRCPLYTVSPGPNPNKEASRQGIEVYATQRRLA
ncbi:MAG: hypothetical protein HY901_16815 [Deltaproteobacteria bacterium]|nr:hypothetical protein [Deltaproteobacteria bacterium]